MPLDLRELPSTPSFRPHFSVEESIAISETNRFLPRLLRGRNDKSDNENSRFNAIGVFPGLS